jgi:hypothetical protein
MAGKYAIGGEPLAVRAPGSGNAGSQLSQAGHFTLLPCQRFRCGFDRQIVLHTDTVLKPDHVFIGLIVVTLLDLLLCRIAARL